MDLQNFRGQIDKIDDEILRLFRERMNISRQIALYKKAHNIPVLDAAREQEKLTVVDKKAGEEFRHYAHTLYTTMLELSREYQRNFTQKITPD
jgi:chorismate mutase/prephenate dehydratase